MSQEPPDSPCSDCREQLHAYLDGELGEAEGAAVGSHLERCAPCFERSQLEEAFRRTIRACTRAASQAPSPALEERLRLSLDKEDELFAERAVAARPHRDRKRSPRPAWQTWTLRSLVAAASFLIAVATWTTLQVPRVGEEEWPAVMHPAFVKGHLVCLDCAMMRAVIPPSGLDPQLPRATLPSSDPGKHHRLHLRCETGRLWELFAEPDSAAALEVHHNAGRAASIVGTAYPEIGVLRVARLRFD